MADHEAPRDDFRGMRRRATQIPGVIAIVVLLSWGADLALRGELNWGRLVWLVVVAGLFGLLSLLLVLPMTLALDWLASFAAQRKKIALLLYVAAFVGLGVALAVGTGAIHPIAGLLGGAMAGVLLAKLCEPPVAP